MVAECPVCGNEISFSLKYEDGKCKYCKSSFNIKYNEKGKKKHVFLEEKIKEDNKKCLQINKTII